MRGYISLLYVVVLWLSSSTVLAQTMQGQLLDVNDGKPMADVNIMNIHTGDNTVSNDKGQFSIEVASGHLISFNKDGYKVLRVRIPQGKLPSYFRVNMQKQVAVIDDLHARGAAKDYKTDSLRYQELYGSSLSFQRLSGLDAVRHPFSAMSKKNRQIWAFQDEYAWYQQQKYIDYTFNEKLINRVTGLGGDSLQVYMQMFRPEYDQLRNMNEYTYYNYIKTTVEAFRQRGIRAKMAPARGSH